MSEELEVVTTINPLDTTGSRLKKRKAKNGRKKIIIRGPKTPKKQEDILDESTPVVHIFGEKGHRKTMADLANLAPPYSIRYSKLEDILAKIRLREGRSMQLTGDAKLIIEALEHITLLLRR
jgi:hypothetical protein